MADKRSALGSHVRQLCALGVEPRLIMPHVVRSLAVIADAEWGMFFYAHDGDMADVFSENAAIYKVMPTYYEGFHDVAEKIVLGTTFRQAMLSGRGWENSARYDDALLRSYMYSDLWRPVGIRHSIEVTAFDGAKGYGSLTLCRPAGAHPFTEHVHADIAPYSRHIAHALAHPAQTLHSPDAPGSQTSMLIVDARGEIVLQDVHAKRMIRLAHGVDGTPGSDVRIPNWLTPLVHGYRKLWEGMPVAPPSFERRNSAGRFLFRAYSLQGFETDGPQEIFGIFAEHFAPLSFAVETLGFSLGLSARQRAICERVLAGCSHRAIARQMGIRESTVIDHVRKIYLKLDISSPAELYETLRRPYAADDPTTYPLRATL